MANTKLKVTHRTRNEKDPVTFITMKFRVPQEALIAAFYNELKHHLERATDPTNKNYLTRSFMEQTIRDKFYYDGAEWWEKDDLRYGSIEAIAEHEKDIAEVIKEAAKRLFPDWFADTCVNLILDLEKE